MTGFLSALLRIEEGHAFLPHAPVGLGLGGITLRV